MNWQERSNRRRLPPDRRAAELHLMQPIASALAHRYVRAGFPGAPSWTAFAGFEQSLLLRISG